MKYEAFEVNVAVNNANLPEYGEETRFSDGAAVVSCWVPSDVGQRFTLSWKTKPVPFQTGAQFYVDGICVGGKVARVNETKTTEFLGRRVSPTTLRELIFSSLETTDEDRYLTSDNTKSLGEIKAEIWEVQFGGLIPASFSPVSATLLGGEPVHERSKKAMAHCVRFGKEEVKANDVVSQHVQTTYLRKIAVFTFEYRSIGILRAQGIAPPDPNAQKMNNRKRKAGDRDDSHKDDDVEAKDSDDEKDEAEVKVLMEKIKKIQSKVKKKGTKSKTTKKVKRETKSSLMLPVGEVIDLT